MRRAPAAFVLCLATAGCTVFGGGKPPLNDAQQVIAAIKFPGTGKAPDLSVAGAANRHDASYKSGGKIVLSAVVDKDASLAVLRVLHDGVTSIVFPNRSQPDAQVAAHAVVRIPLIAGAKGTELFEFIAALDGKSWLFTRKPAEGADYVALGSTTRDLAGDITTTLRGAPGTAAVAHVAVRVEK